MRLTLVRHGVTHWNAAKRFQGHSDTPLSDEGRAQARALAQRLAAERIDAVYASDLSRAFETARIVAEPHGLAVRSDARLREFEFGAWEGLTWAQIVEAEPHLAEGGWSQARLYRPTGGETFEQVTARVRAFFDELLADPQPKDVVVVAHAGALHAALAVLGLEATDADGRHVSLTAASLTRVAMEEGRARLITLSDVEHLYPTG